MAQQNRMRTERNAVRRSAKDGSSKKGSVVAVLLMTLALLVFIALISYDLADEANVDIGAKDLVHVFTGDPLAKAKSDTTHNWLGLVGALISDFLIKSTLGYVILCLPILVFIWGWSLLRNNLSSRLISFTNYTLITAFLVSCSSGMIRLILPETLGMEWSGAIGDFSSGIFAQLLGRVGGSIVLFTAFLVTAIFAINLDLHTLTEKLKSGFAKVLDWFGRMKDKLVSRNRDWRERLNEQDLHPANSPQKSVVTISLPSEDEMPSARIQKEPTIKRPSVEIPLVRERGLVGTESAKGLRLEIEVPKADEEVNFDDRPTPPENQDAVEEIDYVFPSVELLDVPRAGKEDVDEEELKANADLLRATLAQFDVELESVSVTPGPVITLYELVPATGVKISRIVSLENDIALKLAAKGIRIMAPIPGKSAVGVEIPNHECSLVTIRSVINSAKFRDSNANLPLALGKTISGEVFTDDLSKMPHLLMAGSTGSGKSVGINTILASLLFRLHPSDLKLVIIDPKKIELAQYAKLKKHFLAISPDINEEIITNPRNAVQVLKGVEFEMEKRYDKLAAAGVRNIVDYNEKVADGRLKNTETITHSKMPYLIVVIDELADLMITAARDVEEPIARLAQLARAVGVHLIVATQRPSVDVITGVIKANFSARIAYQVASKTDSRTILDMNGAEQLLGNGDMLYLASGSPKPVRLQNAFISTDEVDGLMAHIGKQRGYSKPFMLPSVAEKKKQGSGADGSDRDELFEEAARLIVRHQQGSVSLLQRRLKVGYSRAARLVDELEFAGIVGPFDGSKAREVLVESEAELESLLGV
ncbi:MAG TPA: DNA translocase FtsK [Bacteroidota bacterium]